MTADEAQRLSLDPRVLYVQQDMIATAAIQNNPGWALDRLDEVTPLLDNTYNDSPSNGTGRTIYILDSGIALGNATVAAEFGGRASVIWDVNTGGAGNDCLGHGTQVASAAAGNTYGTAKGANVIAAKITTGCTRNSTTATSTTLFNWLAANAPRGSVVNWSYALEDLSGTCSNPRYDIALEDAIRAAHNAGIMVVVAAGNDGCNTNNYSPTRITEAFVVGATTQNRIANGQDEKWSSSRTGWNISTFAPGAAVATLNYTGVQTIVDGTSISAPYIAGLFATACQASGTVCNTATSAAPLYQSMRNSGTFNTVVNTGGGTLTTAISRFIYKFW